MSLNSPDHQEVEPKGGLPYSIVGQTSRGKIVEVDVLQDIPNGGIDHQVTGGVNKVSLNYQGRKRFNLILPHPLNSHNAKIEKTKDGLNAWAIVGKDSKKRLPVRLPLVVKNGSYAAAVLVGHFLGVDVGQDEADHDQIYKMIDDLVAQAEVVDKPSFPSSERNPQPKSKSKEKQSREGVGIGWHQGKVRGSQEDSYGTPTSFGLADSEFVQFNRPTSEQVARRSELYGVADGMGGHKGGERASSLVIANLFTEYYQQGDDLYRAVLNTQRVANNKLGSQPDTTLVAAVVDRDKKEVEIANLGDSRAYLITGDEARQITSDHTYGNEGLRNGTLTKTEAENHPWSEALVRSVKNTNSLPDIFNRPYKTGDNLLLCSDGLYRYVKNNEIGKIVGQFNSEEAASRLTQIALDRGGGDNITVLVVDL